MRAMALRAPMTAGLARYLVATAVVCGALVMALEVLGSRVIGPFYGVSLFVWTALISVTLVALAAGYVAGGYLSDRRATPDFLFAGLIAAGVWVAGIPWLKAGVLPQLLPLGLRGGALASAAALFGAPLFLLGCVTPATVRWLARDRARLGTTVGALYGWSTLGSLAGTLGTGFVLLAYLDLTQIFVACGAALAGLGAGYFAVFRRRTIALAAIAIPLLAALPQAPVTARMADGTRASVIHSRSGYYGEIKVVEYAHGEQRTREMLIDGLVQGAVDARTGESIYETTYLLQYLPVALRPSGRRCLVIGLGPGIVPQWYRARGVVTDVVDIDSRVVDAARRFFGFSDAASVKVEDARYFLAATPDRYDYVILDVFNGDTTPGHLLSREALALLKSRLEPGGILAANLMASLKRETFMTASVARTFASVFDHVTMHPTFPPEAGDGTGNVVIVAYDGAALPGDASWAATARIHPLARLAVEHAARSSFRFPEGTRAVVLSDDYNPLDFHDGWLKEGVRRRIIDGTAPAILLFGAGR